MDPTDPNQTTKVPTIPKEQLDNYVKAMKDAEVSLEKQLKTITSFSTEYKKVETTLRAQEEYEQNLKKALGEVTALEEAKQEVRAKLRELEKATGEEAKKNAKDALELAREKLGVVREEFDEKKKEFDKDMERQKKLEEARKKDVEELKKTFKDLSNTAYKTFADGFNIPILGTKIRGMRDIMTDIFTAPAEAFKKYGFLDQYAGSINNMRQSLAGFGVTEKEMYEAVGELNQGLADFSGYSKDTQDSLIKTTTQLGLAGFAAGKTTSAMVSLTKVFGQTGTQAEGTIKRIAALSLTLGQGQKGLDDFISLSPKLVGFGDRAEGVFRKTAIAAKKLGMDTQELFGIMDQYDTFEKAANAAGELNVALGGQFVDSLDLMKASLEGGPTDVLKQLQDAFNKSGKSVDNLTRSQIKYFASAAGMKEDQFMKIFKNGGQGIEEYAREQEAAAKKQENLNEIARKTQNIFQEIQNAFAQAFSDPQSIASLKEFVFQLKDLAIKVLPVIKTMFEFMAAHPQLIAAMFAVGPLMSFTSALGKVGNQVLQLISHFLKLGAAKAAAEGVGGIGGAAAGGRGLFGLPFGAALNTGFLGTTVAGSGALGAGGLGGLGAAGLAAAGTAVLGAAGAGATAGYLFNRYALGIDMEGKNLELTPEQQKQRAAIRAAHTEVQDAVAPGGSIITTPQGGRMITSAQDSVIAAKEGGILAQKLDILISKIDELGARPIMMDGKKVNSVLAEANRYNPFVA